MRAHFAAALAIGIAWAPAVEAQQPPTAAQSPLPSSSILTPEAAIVRALDVAPRAAAAAARLDAAAGNLDQAGALPNPEFGVEVENFEGSGPFSGFDSVETTYGLSQTIELGGKRSARVDAARAARLAARHDLAAAQLDLARDVRAAFTEAVAAQQDVGLAAERVRLAQEVERSIQARVEAGRETTVQASRAEIARRQAEIALEQARRRAAAGQQVLSSLIGLEPSILVLDDSWFTRLNAPALTAESPPVETPDLLRREADVLRGRAELEVERSRAVPDVTVSAGVRQFHETDDNAFLVGVSIPIPVFDRNRGAIARARAEVVAAEAELAAERLDLSRRVTAARANLDAARDTASALQAQIIPVAEQAYRAAQEGYQQGKFSYLDVLDAQRTLFDARRDLIGALQGFHTARADLERLLATTPNGER
ncbi:TolC family protein [Indioceanicola profundi]|uniref:TolC family protein n=1 Tax=Indioceanicola profundi TaxID=2220096 RepID=UPI000E6A95F4|nr:TolC family protein [Indioceanicola profundi]